MSREDSSRPAKRQRLMRHEEIIQSLQTESDDDGCSDFEQADDDQDPDFVLESDHDTESEQSGDEQKLQDLTDPQIAQLDASTVSLEASQHPCQKVCLLTQSTIESHSKDVTVSSEQRNEPRSYYGRNRYKWSSQEPAPTSRTPLHNIVRMSSKLGPKTFTSHEDIWSLLFTEEMISLLVTHTNQKITATKSKYKDSSRSELAPTTNLEMKAYIGLLFYTAAFKSNRENSDFIFATDGSGREIFRCVMSQKRFLMLTNCLRFDDSATRSDRLKNDKLAAISELFQLFVNNCQSNYTLGTYVCIDEMLIGYRGRCSFIIYMPQKPDKYGLKLLLLVDAATFYVYNMYIYYGKGSDGIGLSDEEKKLGIPSQSVIRLTKCIEGSHRNITADNWFSSLELLTFCGKKGLTYLGTLKKNKKEIPNQFQPSKQRPVRSSIYGFTRNCTMVSYVPKTNKAVILISSMHHTKEIDVDTGKPSLIIDYNKTKGGVDEVDKKCSNYGSSRRTRRWPMAIFFRLIDMSGINSYILYNDCENTKMVPRGVYLKSLARALVLPQMKLRVYNERIPRELRFTIERMIGPEDLPPKPTSALLPSNSNVKKTCALYPSRLKRRTRFSCTFCAKPMCLACCKQACEDCIRRRS